MNRFIWMFTGILGLLVITGNPGYSQPFPKNLGGVYTRSQDVLIISSYPVSATAGTVTFSTPTAASTFSSGERIYITGVYITAFASATVAGVAPLQCTATNLGGWTADFASTYSAGTLQTLSVDYSGPVVSTSSAKFANVTCPAAPALRWNMQFNYYTAP